MVARLRAPPKSAVPHPVHRRPVRATESAGIPSAEFTRLEESMITRHGRSASTVSSVRPKSDAPARLGGSGITTARNWNTLKGLAAKATAREHGED